MIVDKYQNTKPFTIREKNPRVRKFKGNVSMFIIGFKNMLKRVRHAPTIRQTQIGFTDIPSINLVVPHTATESIIQCAIILM